VTDKDMPSSETESVLQVVVILTSIPIEYKSVKAYLDDIKEDKAEDGTIYEKGVFRSDGQEWNVLIRDIGEGNTRAASGEAGRTDGCSICSRVSNRIFLWI